MAGVNSHGEPTAWEPAWTEPDNIRHHSNTSRHHGMPQTHSQSRTDSSPYVSPARSFSVGSRTSRRPLRPVSREASVHHIAGDSPPDLRHSENSVLPETRRYGSQSRPPRALDNHTSHWGESLGRTDPIKDVPRGDPFMDASPRSQRQPEPECNCANCVPHNRRAHDEEMGHAFDHRYADHGHFYHPHSSAYERGGLGWDYMTKHERRQIMRLPWLTWMNSSVKNHFVAAVGEFVGTTMFLFFAFAGTIVANTQSKAAAGSQTTTGSATGFDVGVLVYIALSFGFSLMVNVWVFFRISGGLFNPAVTLGMMLVKAVSPARAAWLLIAQLGGAISASAIVMALFPADFNVRTTLSPGASLVQGVFIEALLTAELVFTIFMLAKEKHRATFMAPIGIGLALFISELVGVQYTGGSLNPARSFGPCVVTTTFDAEHWIYWAGPAIGTLVAVVFYKFLNILEYEMANPGADGDPTNDPTQNPEKLANMNSVVQDRTSEQLGEEQRGLPRPSQA
ncbi:major intrinsic protein [Sarocladium implicatum]|nr:major intrinsic protein [Sarocladium implicatum]